MDRKQIPDFPEYEVDNMGNIWSVSYNWRNKGPRKLKPSIKHDGHFTVGLSRNGQTKSHLVHRLVALAFIGPPPDNKPHIRHLDGNPANNKPDNLAWGDYIENAADRDRHGKTMRGSNHVFAKLDELKVANILHDLAGGATYRSIASNYNVHHSTIGDIANNISWKHCPRQAALEQTT